MANSFRRNKCANAMQQCAASHRGLKEGGHAQSVRGEPGSPLVLFRKRKIQENLAEAAYLLAGAAAAPLLACALHSLRNFLRSLPCRPLASASLEHSIEAALRGFSALAGAAAAVCARVGVANRSEAAKARPSVREEMAIMEAPMRKGKRCNVAR